MLHLSSYHSNGLPTVVWSNKVNLIGEKVYKPKIHFCEHCNKPILIYGRLIPCKHVFCFTCATLCITQQQQFNTTAGSTPPALGSIEPPVNNQSPSNNTSNDNNSNNYKEKHYQNRHSRGTNSNSNCNSKNLDLHRSDSNHSFSQKDNNNGSLMSIDESTSNTTPTTIQQDTICSPNLNGVSIGNNNTTQQPQSIASKGCHRCGGRALRVERNTLNSIFVCQIDTCKRTYLSARDLQAHVAHRHSRSKQHNSNNPATPSASLAAISSSPYISSSTIMHLNSHNQSNSHRQSSSSTSTNNNSNNNINQNSNPSHNNYTNSPNNHHHRRERDPHHHHHNNNVRDKERDRERDRDRTRYERDSYQRDRDRERDSKEYHRQSLQRAAQWAEASAQMLEKGLTR